MGYSTRGGTRSTSQPPGIWQRGIGPAEGGQHVAHLRLVEPQITGMAGGDGDVAAVQVVDHHGDEQHHRDHEA